MVIIKNYYTYHGTRMNLSKPCLFVCLLIMSGLSYASGTMNEDEINNVDRVEVSDEEARQRLSITAGLLADYEIAAKKLIMNLDNESTKAVDISMQAKALLDLSENVINSAQYRLPQCDEYLAKTLMLKDSLQAISHASLEKDYHHDGALPKAPGECYHTKDLFVHPATVIVLTRDDPTLNEKTKASINLEISEVLAHTEVVRQLVIY
ncbi:MAG: hypothetical protein ACI85N_000618 [Gammaproteobacteria bacterium]|jgi:hypothetical protein